MRSAITLTVLFAMFLGGSYLGFRLLTASTDVNAEPAPTCEWRTFEAGQVLSTNQIRVSSQNASKRSGLANRVLINLQRRGFAPGTVSNADEVETGTVKIITDDPDHPAIRLLAAQFTDRVYYADPIPGLDPDSVTVVVGERFTRLKRGADREIELTEPLEWCVPIITETE